MPGDVVDTMLEKIEKRFHRLALAVDFYSLRLVHSRDQVLSVRRNLVQPIQVSEDIGVMIAVYHAGGFGYAATSDLSLSGLRTAANRACDWANATAGHLVAGFTAPPALRVQGEFKTPVGIPWHAVPVKERIGILREACESIKSDARILDWTARVWHSDTSTLYLNSTGDCLYQRFNYLLPTLSATANEASTTQTRTFGGHTYIRQGGLEILKDIGFSDAAPRIGSEAVQLLKAPNCPSGTMDAVIAPDQMVLQIHETVGHPLELDRILGDERNYAGTSFVTLKMLGSYQYGSPLMNVTFDPGRAKQVASYAFDDEGQHACREYIIRDGILLRPLGGATSQARALCPGVATGRACSWNRPPIDRMANLNLEPGKSSFNDLVTQVECGIYLETNCSWSIDDSRNKFQFGCEWGRLIENGQLTHLVRNPNYRGISATFWRNLKGVGNIDTLAVLGTPYCGKGEPNQAIRVGHAVPACLFTHVDVFGGA
jgi:Predicted Zn-dependent proteases and their inactivated homologs